MATASLIGWLSAGGVKDSTGTLVASGLVYFYAPGTTTQTAVYADKDAVTPLSQPITLDGYGRKDVYVIGRVKMAIHSAAGTLLTTYEDATGEHAEEVVVNSPAFTGPTGAVSENVGLQTLLGRAITSLGGPDFTYSPNSGTNRRNYSVIVEEIRRSPMDYGAAADGTTIDTTAITSAIAAIKSVGGGRLILPPGKVLLIDAQLLIDFNNFTCEGPGWGSIIRANTTSANVFNFSAATNWSLVNFQIDTDTINGTVPAVDVNAASNFGLIDRLYLNCQEECLDLNASDNIVIRNSRIYSSEPSGVINAILLTSADNIRVSGNYIQSVNGAGLSIAGSSERGFTSQNTFACVTGIDVATTLTGTIFSFLGDDFGATSSALVYTGTTTNNRITYQPTQGDMALFSVASAASIHHGGRDVISVAGTADVTRMFASYRGHKITMVFTGTAATNGVVDATAASGEMYGFQLAGAAAFAYSPNDVLEVVFDGSFWLEVGRNAN